MRVARVLLGSAGGVTERGGWRLEFGFSWFLRPRHLRGACQHKSVLVFCRTPSNKELRSKSEVTTLKMCACLGVCVQVSVCVCCTHTSPHYRERHGGGEERCVRACVYVRVARIPLDIADTMVRSESGTVVVNSRV